MGKYDKYPKIVLGANLIKNTVTTSLPGSFGLQAKGGIGNEGVELGEWINEKIADGTIDTGGGSGGNTNLSFTRNSTTVTVESNTGTDAILPVASTTLAGVMSANDKVNINALITLSGVAAGSTNLGTFTGTTIPDNSTIKAALQSIETALNALPGLNVGNLTSANTAISVTGGTNSIVSGGVTLTLNAANILLSALGGSLNISQLSTTGANSGDIIVYNGTAWVVSKPQTETTTSSTSNTVTLNFTPITNAQIFVLKNGVFLIPTDDYTISGSTVTLTQNLITTDKLTVMYYK